MQKKEQWARDFCLPLIPDLRWRELAAMRYVFHLSIPVSDLAAAKAFYQRFLLADIGREEANWIDVLLWGHQITLQLRPDEVLAASGQGKRHFGVVLPWQEWETTAARLTADGVNFYESPVVLRSSTAEEQAKLYLQDPSGNIIEIKAYRNMTRVLGFREDT